MSFQDTQGVLESFKERLSNPFIFTFSWSFIVCNWETFGWFLFEPLKFSLKLQKYRAENLDFKWLLPLGITLIIITTGPFLNNFAEVCKRAADNLLAKLLIKAGWKEYVEKEKLDNAQIEIEQLRVETYKLQREIYETTYKNKDSNPNTTLSTSMTKDGKSEGLSEFKPGRDKMFTEIRVDGDAYKNNRKVTLAKSSYALFEIPLNHLILNSNLRIEINFLTAEYTSGRLLERSDFKIQYDYLAFDSTDLTNDILKFTYQLPGKDIIMLVELVEVIPGNEAGELERTAFDAIELKFELI